METDPSALAAEMARATMCFINLMGVFASPRIIAKTPALPAREHIIDHIEDFLGVLARTSPSAQPSNEDSWRNSEPHVLRLRELLRNWVPEQGISPEVINTARTCLLTLGVDEPPEGWDAFEGIEDQAPTAKTTTPVGDALAVAWRFVNWASIFVIPAFLAAHNPEELRTELLQRIDKYLEVIDRLRDHPVPQQDDEKGLLRLEPFALKLRTLLNEWIPDQTVPSEIIQTVDACLKTVGVSYPIPDPDGP